MNRPTIAVSLALATTIFAAALLGVYAGNRGALRSAVEEVHWEGDCRVASLDPMPDSVWPGMEFAPNARNAAGTSVPADFALYRSREVWGAARITATGKCGGVAEKYLYIDPHVDIQLASPRDTVDVNLPESEPPAA